MLGKCSLYNSSDLHYRLLLIRMLYMVVPVYIAEISPEKLRGRLVMLFSTMGIVGNMVYIH